MKFIKLLFVLFFLVLTYNSSYSQGCPVCYTEQVSGVTTSLNSVSVGTMSMTYPPPQVAWICGDNGVVLRTTNSGTNWLNVTGNGIPTNLNLNNIGSRSPDTALVTGTTGGTAYVYRTINGGLNWSVVFTQTGGYINCIWMRNSLNGFMQGNPVGGRWSLWKTSNGGATWDSTGMRLPQAGSETGFNNSLAVMYSRVWFGTNNSRIYSSTNNGISWVGITTSEANIRAIWTYWDTTFSSTYLLEGGNSVYYSSNAGVNWTVATCPDTARFVGFAPAYLGAFNNGQMNPMGCYATRNGAKVYFGFLNYFIPDYTAPNGTYNHMGADYTYLNYQGFTWAVRNNGGITRIALFRGGAVRSISSKIPESYQLSQNYPNPFNPSTNIRFNLPKTEFVTIKIFDELGREVATVVKELLHAGEYEASYDASSLASGIYFYSLIAPDFVQTKKMILVK